jgi:chromosome segregation ATPase
MRLSRTAWLILGIGIFVIAFATLYTINSRQSGEAEQLSDGLSEVQALLPQLISEREDLEDQLSQWESELAEAVSSLNRNKARLSKSVESIECDEILFDIAEDCDLEIFELTASEPNDEKVRDEDEKVEDITYAVTTFEVKVRPVESPPATLGNFEIYIEEAVANMLDFINTIATGEDFTNATIAVVDMENLEPPYEEEELERAEKPEATIELTIYGYQGE